MKRITPDPIPTYRDTHVSVHDGSPAMVLSTYNGHTLNLVNENGDTWSDPITDWKEV